MKKNLFIIVTISIILSSTFSAVISSKKTVTPAPLNTKTPINTKIPAPLDTKTPSPTIPLKYFQTSTPAPPSPAQSYSSYMSAYNSMFSMPNNMVA